MIRRGSGKTSRDSSSEAAARLADYRGAQSAPRPAPTGFACGSLTGASDTSAPGAATNKCGADGHHNMADLSGAMREMSMVGSSHTDHKEPRDVPLKEPLKVRLMKRCISFVFGASDCSHSRALMLIDPAESVLLLGRVSETVLTFLLLFITD